TVFREITRQTGYSFVYTSGQIAQARPVSLQFKNTDLLIALDACFRQQPFTYQIEGNHIAVREADKKPGSSSYQLSGLVQSENGEPLQGVSVAIKNRRLFTTSDSRGNFILENVEGQDILV